MKKKKKKEKEIHDVGKKGTSAATNVKSTL